MKKIIFSLVIALATPTAFSQVGIGTVEPKATLDVTGNPSDASVLDGVIVPRLTGAQLSAKTYTADQTGTTVYVTTADPAPAGQTLNVTTTGLFTFNGTVWLPQTSGAQNIFNTNGTLTGNRTVSQGANTLAFTSTETNGFSVDGTTLSVDAANNRVGIGTAAPVVGLAVEGSFHFNDAGAASANKQGGYLTWNRTILGGTGTGFVGFLNHQGPIGNGGFVFSTTNNNTTFNELMRISGNGNLGIGNVAPTEKLDVTGNVKFSAALMPNNNAGTAGQVLTSAGAGTAPIWSAPSALPVSNIYSANGSLTENRTVTQGANTLAFTSTETNGFSVDGTTFSVDAANNRIGIGTATPVVSLDTRGSIHLNDDGTATANLQGAYLTWNRANIGGIGPTGGHVGFLNHQGIGSGGFVFSVTNNNSTFNERMRITGSGNVGIGTTTPNAPLQFANTVDNRKLVLFENGNNDHQFYGFGINSGLVRYQTADGADHAFFAATSATTSVELMRIRANGRVGIGINNPLHPLHMGSGAHVTTAGVWTNASDRRLKTNIKEGVYGMKEVMQLRPVAYTMNIDQSAQIGFIAQEVQKIIPEVVSGIEGDITKGETLGIAYGNLVPVLVKALQEQQAEIEQLKVLVKALEAKIK